MVLIIQQSHSVVSHCDEHRAMVHSRGVVPGDFNLRATGLKTIYSLPFSHICRVRKTL